MSFSMSSLRLKPGYSKVTESTRIASWMHADGLILRLHGVVGIPGLGRSRLFVEAWGLQPSHFKSWGGGGF